MGFGAALKGLFLLGHDTQDSRDDVNDVEEGVETEQVNVPPGVVVKYRLPASDQWDFGWVEYVKMTDKVHGKLWKITSLPEELRRVQDHQTPPSTPQRISYEELEFLMSTQEGELHVLGAEEGDSDFYLEPRLRRRDCPLYDETAFAALDMDNYRDVQFVDRSGDASLPLCPKGEESTVKWGSPPQEGMFVMSDEHERPRSEGGRSRPRSIEGGIFSNVPFVAAVDSAVRVMSQESFNHLVCVNHNLRSSQLSQRQVATTTDSTSSKGIIPTTGGGGLAFRLWRFGKAWYIVVDRRILVGSTTNSLKLTDKLCVAAHSTPSPDGYDINTNKMINTEDELWPLYLEKAFAKYLGSYRLLQEPLWQSTQRTAMYLLGGERAIPLRTVTKEDLQTVEQKADWLRTMKQYLDSKTAVISAHSSSLVMGLTKTEYQVLEVRELANQGHAGGVKQSLAIRLRNPQQHGNDKAICHSSSYSGGGSDERTEYEGGAVNPQMDEGAMSLRGLLGCKSEDMQEWGCVAEEEISKLIDQVSGTTELWMQPGLFYRTFNDFRTVTLGPDFNRNGKVLTDPTQYHETRFAVKWKRGLHYQADMAWWPAVGCRDRYQLCPQIIMTIRPSIAKYANTSTNLIISSDLEDMRTKGAVDVRQPPVRGCLDVWRINETKSEKSQSQRNSFFASNYSNQKKMSANGRGSVVRSHQSLIGGGETDKIGINTHSRSSIDISATTNLQTPACTTGPTEDEVNITRPVRYEVLKSVASEITTAHYSWDMDHGGYCTWHFHGLKPGKYLLVPHVTHVSVLPYQRLPRDFNAFFRVLCDDGETELEVLEPKDSVWMKEADGE
eukprot:GHVQ01026102.1.p1 GENE.GHVQ01026102.1~~GHVQ01026102.1.p1  ORF type:complete len:837 (-),score=166.56 GHVQ01026102.1:478-2988(-)